jgi:hypothetical protein
MNLPKGGGYGYEDGNGYKYNEYKNEFGYKYGYGYGDGYNYGNGYGGGYGDGYGDGYGYEDGDDYRSYPANLIIL